MKHLATALILPVLALATPRAAAQALPISVEVRLGAGVPLGDFAETDPGIGAQAGPAFSAGVLLHLSGALSAYAAYGRTEFSCPRCGDAGLDDRVSDAGGELGVQAMLPARLAGASPWVRAGGVYRQLTFSGQGGTLSSDPGLGFEAGGGVSVALTRSISLSPGIRFRTYTAGLDLGEFPGRTVDVSHVVADVGISYRF